MDLGAFPSPSFFDKNGQDRVTVGYAGHLYQGRGIDVIMDAAQRMPQVRFEIIGGEPGDVAYWRERVTAGELTNVNLAGFIPNRDLPRALLKTDILVMPYQKRVAISGNAGNTVSFMSPMKMFEFMATGKPVIASDLPVLREVLVDRVNCLLVPCDDPQAWVDAIDVLVRHPDLARSLGQKARQDVENKYSWTSRALAILEAARTRRSRKP